MTNLHNSAEYPANKALQYFFDDISLSEMLSAPNDYTQRQYKDDEKYCTKINKAERLLERANSIANLLSDCTLAAVEEKPHSSSAHLLSFFPKSQLDNLYVDEILAMETELKPSENKVNEEFADTYNNRQTRDLSISLKDSLTDRFQILLCEIANMTIAIPLVELGGIHQLTTVSKIAKSPSWCIGLLLKGGESFVCVDVSALLVPHTTVCHSKLVSDYEFGVQLGKTQYLLCCKRINVSDELSKDDVKWRENSSTRPWLAGLLKTKMCGLIDGAHMLQEMLK